MNVSRLVAACLFATVVFGQQNAPAGKPRPPLFPNNVKSPSVAFPPVQGDPAATAANAAKRARGLQWLTDTKNAIIETAAQLIPPATGAEDAKIRELQESIDELCRACLWVQCQPAGGLGSNGTAVIGGNNFALDLSFWCDPDPDEEELGERDIIVIHETKHLAQTDTWVFAAPATNPPPQSQIDLMCDAKHLELEADAILKAKDTWLELWDRDLITSPAPNITDRLCAGLEGLMTQAASYVGTACEMLGDPNQPPGPARDGTLTTSVTHPGLSSMVANTRLEVMRAKAELERVHADIVQCWETLCP